MAPKNTICLWFDGTAEEAARFYAKTFPNSAVGAIQRAPGDYPNGKEGDVLTVEFTVMGIPCLGLSGQARFRRNDEDGKDRHRRDRNVTADALTGAGAHQRSIDLFR